MHDCWAGSLQPFTCANGYQAKKTGKKKADKTWEEYTCCSASDAVGCNPDKCTSPGESEVYNFTRVNKVYDCWGGDFVQPLTCEDGYAPKKTGITFCEKWEEYTCCSAAGSCDEGKCTSAATQEAHDSCTGENITCAKGYDSVSRQGRYSCISPSFTTIVRGGHGSMGLAVPASSSDHLPFFDMYIEFMSGYLGLKGTNACYYSGSFNFMTPEYQMVTLIVLCVFFAFFFRHRHARAYWLEGQSLDDPYDLSVAFEDFKLRAKVGALLAARDTNRDGIVDVAKDIEKVEMDIRRRTMRRIPDDNEDRSKLSRGSKSFVHAVLFSQTYSLIRSISLSVHQQFEKIDTNKNRTISFAEYQNYMQKENEDMTEADLRDLFDRMDLNGDGTVSLNEFDRCVSRPSFKCSLERFAHFVFNFILLTFFGFLLYLVTVPPDRGWPNHTPRSFSSTVDSQEILLIYCKIMLSPIVLILLCIQLLNSMVLETETHAYLNWVKVGTPETYPYNILWKGKEFGGSLMFKFMVWIAGLVFYGRQLAHDTSMLPASISFVSQMALSWTFFSILVASVFYTVFAGIRRKFQQFVREHKGKSRLPASAIETETGGENNGSAEGAGVGGRAALQREGTGQYSVAYRTDLDGADDGFVRGVGRGGDEDEEKEFVTDMQGRDDDDVELGREPSILEAREFSTLKEFLAPTSLEDALEKAHKVESDNVEIPGAVFEQDRQACGDLMSKQNDVYPKVDKAQSLEEAGIDTSFHHALLTAGLDLETLLMVSDDRSYLASELEKSGISKPGDRIKILNILRKGL